MLLHPLSLCLQDRHQIATFNASSYASLLFDQMIVQVIVTLLFDLGCELGLQYEAKPDHTNTFTQTPAGGVTG